MTHRAPFPAGFPMGSRWMVTSWWSWIASGSPACSPSVDPRMDLEIEMEAREARAAVPSARHGWAGAQCGVVEVGEQTLRCIGRAWDSSTLVGGDGNCMSEMGNLAINVDGSASDMATTKVHSEPPLAACCACPCHDDTVSSLCH